jgi:hypothetical protein
MSVRLLASAALAALLAPAASAADGADAAVPPALPPQHITYDIALNGAAVGTRELTIRYLPREDGERRVLEAWSDVTIAGQHLACRTTGQSSARGATFTSAVEQQGNVAQVQGIALPGGGWRVTEADATGVHETTLGHAQVRLTSLDLLDPGRNGVLAGGGDILMLLVETGDVFTGAVDAGQPGTTKVAGQKVAVTRYSVQGKDGLATFDIDADGILVKSELHMAVGIFTAVARAVPPPRSYGTVDLVDPLSTGVIEDQL